MRHRRLGLILLVILMLSFSAEPAAFAATARQKADKLPYWLEVDIANQLVFAHSTKDNQIVRVMLCSTAKSSRGTPRGTFYMPKKKYGTERGPWHAMMGGVYARYATRIRGSILFHSIIYKRKKISTLKTDTWKKLGTPASAGCIRLTPLDAQWIAYHCATNTRVVIKSGKKSADRKALHDQIKKSLPPAQKDGTLPNWEAVLQPTPTPVPPTFTLGSKSTAVKTFQKRLRALGFYGGKIDGKYSASTATAVKRLQAAMNLEQTGNATNEFRTLANRSDAPTGHYVTLKKGDKGPAVARIQTELKALGLFKGSANGTFGTSTVTAVKKFYAQIKLKKRSDATPIMQNQLSLLAGQAMNPTPTPSPTPTPAPALSPAPAA